MRQLLLSLFLGLCLSAAAQAERQNILILGDSLTAGYGLETSQAYPALLQEKIDAEKLDYNVINAGISGDTTTDGLRRTNWLLKKPPAIFLLALGANDGLRGLPVKNTRENLEGILQLVKQKYPAAKLIIAGMMLPPNMGDDYTVPFAELFPAVAQAEGATLIPFLLEGVAGRPELNQSDRIHPTIEGQKIVADLVWKTLRPLLKSNKN